MSRHNDDGHHDWPAEFDRRKAAGAPVDRGMSGDPRVQDATGNWFTRSGKSCCGCGLNRNREGVDVYGDGTTGQMSDVVPRRAATRRAATRTRWVK